MKPAHSGLKLDYRRKEWKTWSARLLLISENIIETAYGLPDAKKPHDLVYHTTRLIELVNQVKALQWDWVAEKIGVKKDGGRFTRV